MGTLAEADRALRGWAAAALDGAEITGEPPRPVGAPPPTGPRLSLYLLDLTGERELQGGRERRPLRYALRYLVTADGADRGEAADLLGRLLDATVDAEHLTVRLDPPTVELWIALGAPPQPSFQVEVPASTARPRPTAPLVTEPLIVDGGLVRTLQGRLVGPGGRSMPGATIVVDGTATRVRTGPDGGFRIPAVAGPEGRARFRVVTKGREFLADVALDDGDDHLVIHVDPRET